MGDSYGRRNQRGNGGRNEKGDQRNGATRVERGGATKRVPRVERGRECVGAFGVKMRREPMGLEIGGF